ncbi:hypothetical protein FOZ76_14165 [Verticiella sediminum]|uniref:Histidine kinase domain-containing protein n=1 Tax=Verticiella sediminum TaxID=1247510 RepID=A0A556AKH8_9BURK|nr:ATP-binding protein [Verticiella sediminum]TSH93402.1 hypothetical protein FOZ76_14165 [Verticiella sediminum]
MARARLKAAVPVPLGASACGAGTIPARRSAASRARLALWSALLLLLAWQAALAAAPSPAALDAPTVRLLDAGWFAEGGTDAPPADGWMPVALPDNWRLSRPHYGGYGWYRLPFTLPEVPRQPMAIYIPRLALVGELWLNGSLLNPGVRFDGPAGRGVQMADEPLHVVAPSGLFRPGENVLEVRLQGESAIRSGLSAVRLGAAQEIHRIWLPRYLLQVVAPYVLMVLVVGALCFVLGYALRRRRQLLPMQFALLAGIVTLASYLMAELPMSRGSQQAVRILISIPMYWALGVAGYHLAGIRLRGFLTAWHTTTLLTLAAAAGWLILGGVTDQVWLLTWPHVLLRWIPIGLLCARAWRDRSVKFLLLGLSAGLWNVTIMQSYLILMEWTHWDSFRWSVTGALPFALVLLFVFAERFVQDHEDAVRAQRAAVAAERERILQDMHDGMGAQLITALRLVQRPGTDPTDLARAIEEALQDLRLIIDSLDLTENDLLPLLGNLRFRLEPRLALLGIRLEWEVEPPLPQLQGLNPESALAVLRIVQEAINNALQHAHATRIRISIKPQDGGVAIRVADDGHGIVPGRAEQRDAQGSRGLAGMRQRAARLGATLKVDSGTGGTAVELWLPAGGA